MTYHAVDLDRLLEETDDQPSLRLKLVPNARVSPGNNGVTG